MSRRRTSESKRPIESYDHRDKERLNNPPVGLVTPETDRDAGRMTYAYDPHLDPQIQWAGKAEHTSFEVPTVSLHVHERIDPRTIIDATRKLNGSQPQLSLFEAPEENPPIRQAIEFYKHPHNWSNRLIAGDSLLVMNSLLEKEGMAGKVQMIYVDPPYGIGYGSNFQPFVNRREVRDGRDEDLTQEPETIKAFRDTWELGIHSYLSYLRDRLLLANDMLTESGSCFVQIGDENVHRIGALMDEIFGAENRVATISYATTGGSSANTLPQIANYLLWYAKDRARVKYRQLYEPLTRKEILDQMNWDAMVELRDGNCRPLEPDEKSDPEKHLPQGARLFHRAMLTSQHESHTGRSEPYRVGGRIYDCPRNRQWQVSKEGLDRLRDIGRLDLSGDFKRLAWKHYEEEIPGKRISNIWSELARPVDKRYVVQTATKPVQRCILMTTDPGDLVFDPTCGSGTCAQVAEQWGRRWITCDTSRVAIAVARQRLMTANFDYYVLAHLDEGVASGFKYRTVPYVSPATLAYNRSPSPTVLYDQPLVDTGRKRVTGPFSVEAVPAPVVKPIDDVEGTTQMPADHTVARSGETLRQAEWRDELLKTGIRGKARQFIRFARLEPLPGCRYIHADGQSLPNTDGADSVREGAAQAAQRVVVSFGPEHAPLEQRQVNQALQEAETLRPSPRVIVFAAFQFDAEAAKDIDETNWPGMSLLKAQMNADLLTEDLKRKRSSNESFWLIGQPDVHFEAIRERGDEGKYRVSVQGFDYYNTKIGDVESGGPDKIAIWMLDPDYDGRSLYPRQVFFPMAGSTDGWARLARNLKTEIDEALMDAYRGTVSLPFEPGEHCRIAVKIVDDRGIESLKVIRLDPLVKAASKDVKHRIEEAIAERSKKVPIEEWDRLPSDLIDNLDHYLYGTDKE